MILFFESSRSAEKILGSGKNATKIKSPRAALKRYSESGTIPLLKKKCVNSSSPQGLNEKILGSGKNTATKKKCINSSSPRGALKRYSEARKVPLQKKCIN